MNRAKQGSFPGILDTGPTNRFTKGIPFIIYIKEHIAKSTFSNRHLRQYGKIAAAYKWSGHSDGFVSSGFYPINPLQSTDHIVVHKGISVVTQLASFFLTCLATKSATQERFHQQINQKQESHYLSSYPKKHIARKSHITVYAGGHIRFGVAGATGAIWRSWHATYLTTNEGNCIKVMDTAYAAKTETANSNAVRSYSQTHLSPTPLD
ncbi:hypothetical protein K492DRAFT_200154 [Lichtheimia hyalospora FSU 10163]|nr:hypothetical protein K492DRAFT_200154 [Lichtheimia hyalospora FSU 10163]